MRRAPTQPALHDGLMERVMGRDNLRSAWKQVKANRGALGVDGMTVDEFVAFAREHWPAIRQALLDGSYSPRPLRRVEIPKPLGRGVRLLGIPTVLDRLIAQAIQQVLTPIFDPEFSESSFGFRPGRGAHGALRQVQRWGVSMDYRLFKLAEYVRGWTNYYGISDYYCPVPEIDKWIRRHIRRCYWKQWRWARTKVRHLLVLGTGRRQAIFTALSRKSYWHLSKTLATQTGMPNKWLQSRGLISVRDLWMKAHGYV